MSYEQKQLATFGVEKGMPTKHSPLADLKGFNSKTSNMLDQVVHDLATQDSLYHLWKHQIFPILAEIMRTWTS
jgi:hypothetical protein